MNIFCRVFRRRLPEVTLIVLVLWAVRAGLDWQTITSLKWYGLGATVLYVKLIFRQTVERGWKGQEDVSAIEVCDGKDV